MSNKRLAIALIATIILLFVASINASSEKKLSVAGQNAIKKVLQSVTEVGEGAIVATAKFNKHTQPWTRKDVEIVTFGEINANNSLRFGSISKSLLVDMAFKVAQLDLESRVVDYGFSPAEYPESDLIKLEYLMDMGSGIQEYAVESLLINFTADPINWAYDGEFTNLRTVDLAWKNTNLSFVPNSKYCYSNTNINLVAEIIKRITGMDVADHLRIEFGSLYSSLQYANESTPVGGWPIANGYQDWPYPSSLTGAAGSLIGRADDIVLAVSHIMSNETIFNKMKTWHDGRIICSGIGSDTVAGSSYGFGLQRYDNMYRGKVYGHDASLISRSMWAFHPKIERIFFFQNTNGMNNSYLLTTMNKIMKIIDEDGLSLFELFLRWLKSLFGIDF